MGIRSRIPIPRNYFATPSSAGYPKKAHFESPPKNHGHMLAFPARPLKLAFQL